MKRFSVEGSAKVGRSMDRIIAEEREGGEKKLPLESNAACGIIQ
jgi:hypothetical protein